MNQINTNAKPDDTFVKKVGCQCAKTQSGALLRVPRGQIAVFKNVYSGSVLFQELLVCKLAQHSVRRRNQAMNIRPD